MISPMFFLGIISSYNAYNEYEELNEEEKYYIDYVNKCLFHSDEKIGLACTKMMFLIFKSSALLNNQREMSEEEIQHEKSIIYSGLNNEEKEIVDSFELACIQTLGIYSREETQKKELKIERK